jgi:hypothetical protein
MIEEAVGKKAARDKAKFQYVVKDNKILQYAVTLAVVAICVIAGVIALLPKVGFMMAVVGGMLFLPVGIVVGFLFFNPYMRCRVMRTLTHKNYGIVHFVGRAKFISTTIKDFDSSVLWRGNSLYLFNKGRIYNYAADYDGGDPVESKSVFYRNSVPSVFFDLETMTPLTFNTEVMPTSPQQAGASIKAWNTNQLLKWAAVKWTFELTIIAVIGIALVGYMVYTMDGKVSKIDGKTAGINATVYDINARLMRIPMFAGNTSITPAVPGGNVYNQPGGAPAAEAEGTKE